MPSDRPRRHVVQSCGPSGRRRRLFVSDSKDGDLFGGGLSHFDKWDSIKSSTSLYPLGKATSRVEAPASSSAFTDSGVRRAVQYESTHAFTASGSGVLPSPSVASTSARCSSNIFNASC